MVELLWSEKSESEIRPADFAPFPFPSSCIAEWKRALRPIQDTLGLHKEDSKRDATTRFSYTDKYYHVNPHMGFFIHPLSFLTPLDIPCSDICQSRKSEEGYSGSYGIVSI